jgi:hypothetical protein
MDSSLRLKGKESAAKGEKAEAATFNNFPRTRLVFL